MPRIHDILAVHGVGEQERGETLSVFAEHFYKSVRRAVQEVGQDPNKEIKLVGRYKENILELHYRDHVFRLREISWERSFKVPGAGQVLAWLWHWSSLYLAWAYARRRDEEIGRRGHGPLPRSVLLLFVLLDATVVVPLIAVVYWLWTSHRQVQQQKTEQDSIESQILKRSHLATGLGMALSVPLITGVVVVARLARAGADWPIVGGLAGRIAQSIENLVIGSAGDGMLYIFDSVQAAFIRGDLERAVHEAYGQAKAEGREPLIHVIGHSLGSVIAYEVVSFSLDPEIRKHIKTLCTMGTVLEMIRFLLRSGGLVLAERARFSQDLPRHEQGTGLPRWLNLFARNDPAPGFGPLTEFDQDPTNRPVASTPKGHSTYWYDVDGVHRVFLAWVARDDPVLGRVPEQPPKRAQTDILKDVGVSLGKLLLLVGIIAAVMWVGRIQFGMGLVDVAEALSEPLQEAVLPWPLSWLSLALVWLLTGIVTVVVKLPGWYLRWLLWMIGLLAAWVLFLGVPTWVREAWRWMQIRRLVPVEKGASLNYWVAPLKGMGPDHVLALRKMGIWSLHEFLAAAVGPDGVRRIADRLDVPQEQVMAWARQANLMRLRGVGFKEAATLMEAGIDSLAKLSQEETTGLEMEEVDVWAEQAKQQRDVI